MPSSAPTAHRARNAPPSAAAPFAPGDPVSWGGGRFEGVVALILNDGRAECVAISDGRRWRLSVDDLSPVAARRPAVVVGHAGTSRGNGAA